MKVMQMAKRFLLAVGLVTGFSFAADHRVERRFLRENGGGKSKGSKGKSSTGCQSEQGRLFVPKSIVPTNERNPYVISLGGTAAAASGRKTQETGAVIAVVDEPPPGTIVKCRVDEYGNPLSPASPEWPNGGRLLTQSLTNTDVSTMSLDSLGFLQNFVTLYLGIFVASAGSATTVTVPISSAPALLFLRLLPHPLRSGLLSWLLEVLSLTPYVVWAVQIRLKLSSPISSRPSI